MREELSRLALLAGEENVNKLQNATVAVFGLGGVGSAAAEALARCGVGHFKLIDNDTVARSNINRQIIATENNIGQKKILAQKERILSLKPNAETELYECFYLPGNQDNITLGCDYVIDAIDTVSGKIAIIEECLKNGVPVISSMGTGNKFDPSRLKIEKIEKTSVCPLCRVMRRELKVRGIKNIDVIFSDEEPVRRKGAPGEKTTPGSFMPVTACAGLMLAGFVMRKIMDK